MTNDYKDRQRRLAIALAEAQLVVLACQEQVAKRVEQLAEAKLQLRACQEWAKGAADRLASRALIQPKQHDS